MTLVPYKVRGRPSDHTCGENMILIPYMVGGTIKVIDSYKVPAVHSNHKDTSH